MMIPAILTLGAGCGAARNMWGTKIRGYITDRSKNGSKVKFKDGQTTHRWVPASAVKESITLTGSEAGLLNSMMRH
jgi:hypothetical protein